MTNTDTRPRSRRITSGRLGLALSVIALTFALGVPSEAARLIHGSSLQNGSVTGHKIKNGSLTGKDLRNNSVKGADVKESTLRGLLRTRDVAAYGDVEDANINDFTASDFTSLIATTFRAPRAGVLYITGSIAAMDDTSLGGDGRLAYRLRLDASPLTLSLQAHMLAYAGMGGADSGAVTSVVPVSRGQHTVHLDGLEDGTGSFITSREISVLFLPTGKGFTPPGRQHTQGR